MRSRIRGSGTVSRQYHSFISYLIDHIQPCRHVNACHFWLNEGWTTYIERLLLQIIYTPAHRGFSFLIGSKALYDDLKLYESQPKYQRLQIDFEYGESPDDAFSSVPYDKGANFLLYVGEF